MHLRLLRLAEFWQARQELSLQRPGDVDHPHVPPRVGPRLLSEQGLPDAAQAQAPVILTGLWPLTPFETHQGQGLCPRQSVSQF